MNSFFSILFLLLSFFLFGGSLNLAKALTLSPEEILSRCDDIRNPKDSFMMKVTVTDEKENKKSEFEVFTQGKERTLIKTLAPKKDLGRNLLMIDDNMWAYIPNLKRSVRISLSQKLTGQTANGDISRMRWAGDYDVILENETKDEFQLFLTAKKDKNNLTYSKIRITVNKKDFHPVKASYLTLTDKELKRANFNGFKMLAKEIRPSIITIENALDAQDKSIITIESMELKKFNDNFFDKDRLGT